MVVSGNILASSHDVVGYWEPRGRDRHLRASPSSGTCLLYQFPFEYVTIKDKQAHVDGYNSKRALYEFCLC